MDHVDAILRQWRSERPDLDVTAMGTTGRINRLSGLFVREMEKTWARFGLHHAAFDVLATLRRSGPPYALSPGELITRTMVTSGTMTNRIDQLEKAGWVRRTQKEQDKRRFQIALTPQGRALIDRALAEHVKTLRRLTDGIAPKELTTLNGLLGKMLLNLEGAPDAPEGAQIKRGQASKN
jgi:DNA-binding MarR family transcriptional regulator